MTHDDLPLRPMAELVECGWWAELVDRARELGVHLALYVDDVDGSTALGWLAVPVELTDLVEPDIDLILARRAALAADVARILTP